ncbi:MAG: glycosyltransferase family 2 protein [Candidatus Omnitrophica bacterium]|nr:glycosyltransferase family 2 protein [Candidatus Omnitrophota bacterium]
MISGAGLSVIIPVYNEKELLAPAIKRSMDALSSGFSDYELIIVNDGSDASGTLELKRAAGIYPGIKVINNDVNLNLGISIQRGFMAASKDHILFNSIDLPLAPEDYPALIEKARGLDMLILQREVYAGASLWRKITSRSNLFLIKTLFPVASRGIRDLNYTFIFRRDIRSKIMPVSKSPAFTQPEMILRAIYNKLKVQVVTVPYHPRTAGKASLGKPHDIIWSMYDMLRFRVMAFRRFLR